MTDMGRRPGDMMKSDYDSDEDGVIAVDQTEADMKKSVYDTGDDGVVDNSAQLEGESLAEAQDHTPKSHTHEESEITDLSHDATHIAGVEVDGTDIANEKVLQYNSSSSKLEYETPVGGGPADAIRADGTANRYLRLISLSIDNGSSGDTLKCETKQRFNGDVIGSTDNIPINGAAGVFSLDSAAKQLYIDAAGFTGNVIGAIGAKVSNASNVAISLHARAWSNGMRIIAYAEPGATTQDFTDLVDVGVLWIDILYVTDA